MEGFRQYLGKTVTLGTKKCGPGECFVRTFYTINLAEGLFVFKDVRKKTPTEIIDMKQPYVGFKLDDVTSFQLDLFANAQAAAKTPSPAPAPSPAETTTAAEKKTPEEPEKPEPAAQEPAKEAPAKPDAAAKEPEKRHRLNIQRSKSAQADKPNETAAEETPKAATEAEATETPAAKEDATAAPADGVKPAHESNRGRGSFQRRGGFRGGHRRVDDLPLQTPESLEKIKSEEYDFATASMAFEKSYGTEGAEEEEEQPGAYEKDDFFDSLTSETQESHRGRGRGRRGGRGRGRGNYNGNYNNSRGGRGGYNSRGGRGGGYGRGGYNRRGRGGETVQA